MSLGHSPVAPSSAFRWAPCPASVGLQADFPALEEDPSAAEGVAAHWVGFSMLRTHAPKIGDICPENGAQITEEMLEGALVYNNTVFAIANTCGGLSAAHLEETLPISRLHLAMFGTPDCWIWDPLNGVLHVLDFKFGHLSVDPYQNLQLACYARAILDKLGFDGADEENIRVRFTIVQPRAYHSEGPVRTWECHASDLRGLWNLLHASAAEALEPGARFAVGAHCRDCTGRRSCPTLARNTQAAMDYANSAMPVALSPGQLGIEVGYLERAFGMLEARLKALKQQAEHAIRSGQVVPGYAVGPGRGSRKWRPDVDAEEVRILGEMCGVDLLKPSAAVTPVQASNLLVSKGLDDTVIAEYSVHTPGALQLITADKTIAHRVFAKGNI